MTCAACAARVQSKLSKLDGVTASVNFATERARVTAPVGMTPQTLTSVIVSAGYTAELAKPPGTEEDPDATVRALKRRLYLALVFFIPLTDASIVLSLFGWARFPGWQWVLVALAAPVATWAAWPFHRAALKNARHGTTTMDTLVSMGIIAACGWSVYAMFFLDKGHVRGVNGGGVYLEVAASVTTFLLAGRLYEARARRTAGQAMRLLAEAGAKDVRVLADDGTETLIPATELRVGQRFVVRPGERIAADGIVLSGQSAVDRSMMTGESVPADVTAGEQVTGGTITLTGRLIVRAERVGRDTQLAHLIAMVERAQAEKAGVQRLADRVCTVFVPCVLLASALTLAGWLLASALLAGGSAGGPGAEHAFSAALAVLIIACPCALGLATPAALVVASGRGAQLGIFIKGYQALEASRQIDTVVLDKTGTVTTGQMSLAGLLTTGDVTRSELLANAGAVEHASEHSVARAIADAAGSLAPVEEFRALPGLGARGLVDGREVIVGRAVLFEHVPADLAEWGAEQERLGRTYVLAGWDGAVRGAFCVADTIKPSAAPAIASLHGLGLRTILLTGDNQATAEAVADAVGVDEVISGALPTDKAAVIAELEATGRSALMVGDGVNDGPALAQARLGAALGSGTDVAICAADLVLLRDDLGAVPDAIVLARATHRTIRRNLAWAFCYNLLAIPVAAVGLLDPVIAAAAMTLSSAFVVWNSLRLRGAVRSADPGPGGGAAGKLEVPAEPRAMADPGLFRRRGSWPRQASGSAALAERCICQQRAVALLQIACGPTSSWGLDPLRPGSIPLIEVNPHANGLWHTFREVPAALRAPQARRAAVVSSFR
jgi:P-type Cu+ transporter